MLCTRDMYIIGRTGSSLPPLTAAARGACRFEDYPSAPRNVIRWCDPCTSISDEENRMAKKKPAKKAARKPVKKAAKKAVKKAVKKAPAKKAVKKAPAKPAPKKPAPKKPAPKKPAPA